jgi:hypothetical protein
MLLTSEGAGREEKSKALRTSIEWLTMREMT